LSWPADLWLASLLLATVALAIVTALIFARFVAGVLRTARTNQRSQMVQAVFGNAVDLKQGWTGTSRKQLVDISVELIQMVRGTDREQFINRATNLGVPALLRHQLDSGSVRVRISAAEALGHFHDQQSLDRLHAALGDSNASVRLSAALSLAAAGAAPPVGELIDKLGVGITEHSRLTVALFREIAARSPEELRAIIPDPSIPAGAKADAIEAMSAAGAYSIVKDITALVLSAPTDSPELPRYLRALAQFAHPSAQPAVLRAFGSENWEARSAAAFAAGRIGLVELAPGLQLLLNDPDWWVRFRAGEALTRLGEPGVVLLQQVASVGDEPARSAAALTLAERGLE